MRQQNRDAPSGLIPAHAGKTGAPPVVVLENRAHPRSRGENADRRAEGVKPEGSSPLTRGKRYRGSAGPRAAGLIPAHAGKTTTAQPPDDSDRAHPRSRGENSGKVRSRCSLSGSSPLTRGKLRGGRHLDLDPGLIPAHAGKTPRARERYCAGRAHPRSRGENLGNFWRWRHARGSSPLTRGKPFHRTHDATVIGLIPAHAGKTGGCGSSHQCDWAHPRSRGENDGRVNVKDMTAWLIPAHAGKTPERVPVAMPARAHPRSRGENAAL